MKVQREKQHIIDFLFPIALFFVFAASALAVVLMAASVYEKTAASAERSYESRTSLDYVTEKIRQSDSSGSVSAGTIDGLPCLTIRETYGNTAYLTMIYAYDGMLKELFVQEGVTVNADDGTEILPIQDFRVSEPEDGLFRISCTTGSGEEISSWAALRSASGDHSGEGGSQ